jgi:hypothetical protein
VIVFRSLQLRTSTVQIDSPHNLFLKKLLRPLAMGSFICEKIDVRCEGVPAEPVSFTWQGIEYRIAAVKHSWHDWGFPRAAPKKDWRSRRHRTYFHVQIEDGRLFEIYLDRAHRGKPAWILHKVLSH